MSKKHVCGLCRGKSWFHYLPDGIISLGKDETCVKACPACDRYDDDEHAARHNFGNVRLVNDGIEDVFVVSEPIEHADLPIIVRYKSDGEVLALFIETPGITGEPGSVTCFTEKGGHDWCGIDFMLMVTKQAAPDSEEKMISLLERLGYDPVIRQRFTKKSRQKLAEAHALLKGASK